MFLFSSFSINGQILEETCRNNKSRNEERLYSKLNHDSITAALDYQIKRYPSSQYRDIYKNFMQDFFGPGHLLTDTAASGKYLRQELTGQGPFDGPDYEKTGVCGNFYRVNLSLIRNGVIPYDLFFQSFVESAQGVEPPSNERWLKIWTDIDDVIKEKALTFPEEETDRRELGEQFERGEFVVHHSKRYNDSVNFHYRIISRKNFERDILPLLRQSSTPGD